jgi:hypothetical protein
MKRKPLTVVLKAEQRITELMAEKPNALLPSSCVFHTDMKIVEAEEERHIEKIRARRPGKLHPLL